MAPPWRLCVAAVTDMGVIRPAAVRLAVYVLVTGSLWGSVMAASQPQNPPCTPAETAALDRAETLVHAIDDGGATEYLRETSAGSAECAAVTLARAALDGWNEARRLALSGGDPQQLGSVQTLLDWLAGLGNTLQVQYATTVIRAAVAAAQDERDEMGLYLMHADWLAGRLALVGERARWPLPPDLVAGELWFEVDRYADAQAAYTRASASGRSRLGLARAAERGADTATACRAYRDAGLLPLSDAARRQVDEGLRRLACGKSR